MAVKNKPEDVIVTYGEGNSVGKEMLRRYWQKRQGQSLSGCAICRIMYPSDNDPSGECPDCRSRDDVLPWSSPSGS